MRFACGFRFYGFRFYEFRLWVPFLWVPFVGSLMGSVIGFVSRVRFAGSVYGFRFCGVICIGCFFVVLVGDFDKQFLNETRREMTFCFLSSRKTTRCDGYIAACLHTHVPGVILCNVMVYAVCQDNDKLACTPLIYYPCSRRRRRRRRVLLLSPRGCSFAVG